MTDTPRTRRRLTDAPAGGPEPWAPSGRIDGLVRLGGRVRAAVVASWVVVLFLILRHTIFLSLDTVSNYVHVWWVGDNLRAGHGIPFHMPVIGHGQALAFPYGFVPWLTAGLLWPVLGDWVVTLWIALGFVLVVTAMFWALPEIRRGWWAAAALLNPMLVLAPIVGQRRSSGRSPSSSLPSGAGADTGRGSPRAFAVSRRPRTPPSWDRWRCCWCCRGGGGSSTDRA